MFKKGSAKASALAVVFGGVLVGFAIAGQEASKRNPQPVSPTDRDSRMVVGDYYVKSPDLSGRNQTEPLAPASGNLVAHLREGATAEAVAQRYGIQVVRKLADGRSVVFNSGNAQNTIKSMGRDKDVLGAQLDEVRQRDKHQFVPNDPYFNYNNPAGFPGQWHLKNNSPSGGPDAKLEGAWNKLDDFGNLVVNTGQTVIMGIVDDGFETAHPDLSPNYNAANSRDFGQADNDPNPVNASDDHGTAVAGVAAARGGNSVGVTGAAPTAQFAGLRVDFFTSPASHFVDATTWNSSGQNTNIKIKNHSYGYTGTFIAAGTEVAALETSALAGTIHTWSAGNARGTSVQDSNKLATQSSPNAITVAALASDGRFSPYSSFGANVFVTAPSSGYFNPETGFSEGDYPITTTDRSAANGYNPAVDTFPDQAYTSQFGGTSSSSPLVAGILALAKRNQANLNTRWAKHLLARSSDVVHADDNSVTSDGGWKTNAAGFKFNQNYGFGLINADRLTQYALKSTGVSTLDTFSSGSQTVNLAIPDNNPTGLTRTFNAAPNSSQRLEEVLVTINATHTYRGDLEAYLTSPQGTTSRLFIRSGSDSADNISWTFVSNAFWGEQANGTWTLKIVDTFAGDVGTLQNWTLSLRQGTVFFADSQFVNQSVPTFIQAGQTAPVSVTFRNTGSVNWTAATNYKLNAMNPVNNSTWGLSAVNLAGGDNIAPGSNKTFSYNVTAPGTWGEYDFQWRMWRDGFFRFGDFTPNQKIWVGGAGRQAWFVSQDIPSTMTRSAFYTISVTMRNMGTTPWEELGLSGTRLGSQNPQDNLTWTIRRMYMPLGTVVPPGGTHTFTYVVRAPGTAGVYNMQWRMLQEGVAWFGQFTPNVAVNVVNP